MNEVLQSDEGKMILRVPDIFNRTIQHIAAESGVPLCEMGDSLTIHGFQPKDMFGRAPIHLAIEYNHNDLLARFLREIVENSGLFDPAEFTLFKDPKPVVNQISGSNWEVEDSFRWRLSPVMLAVLHRNNAALDILLGTPLGELGGCPQSEITIQFSGQPDGEEPRLRLKTLGPAHVASTYDKWVNIAMVVS
ncbi:hypothetical protein ABW19_dt0203592 [Dactylella cylindrospora]|nr:hypothetical protein ABW19_dt0203592 [Dactylella cylindrospora]